MPWLDIIVGLLLLNGLFVGWRGGFFASAFRCIGLILALYLTRYIIAQLTVEPALAAVAFVAIFFLAMWLCQLLIRLITQSAFGRFGVLDNILGALVNGAFTLVMIWIVIVIILSVAPSDQWTTDPSVSWITESYTYRHLRDFFLQTWPELEQSFLPHTSYTTTIEPTTV